MKTYQTNSPKYKLLIIRFFILRLNFFLCPNHFRFLIIPALLIISVAFIRCKDSSKDKLDGGTGLTQNGSGEAKIVCPTDYVAVPPLADYTTKAFCVMKYEAKALKVNDNTNDSTYDTNGCKDSTCLTTHKPASSIHHKPWINISRNEAISECTSLGAGYDLITNDEWQTLARNIENIKSNWTGGNVGSGCLHTGNSGNSNCGYSSNTLEEGATRNPRSGHTLSNNEIVWNLADNVKEWVKDDNSNVFGADAYMLNVTSTTHKNAFSLSNGTTTIARNAKDQFGPSGSYDSTNPTNHDYRGLGYGYLNASAGAISRSSSIGSGAFMGLFSVQLRSPPAYKNPGVGFRCVYRK